jgi:folate-binding protein YgfZ
VPILHEVRNQEDQLMTELNIDTEIAIISVNGTDSKTFLQGQLSNDINLLDHQSSIFAAHLNNKGRVLATFIITKIDDNTYYLLTSREIIDKITPRLKMFVLRAKVNINQINDKHIILCENINPQNAQLPNTLNWKLFLINNGIPLVYNATEAEFIPQHINYDLIDGVSFTKGCYTGQEIVARTHYLGKSKRRMYQFTCETSHVAVGQKVISPKLNNQPVGIIVETINQNNISRGLVSLQTDCTDAAFIDGIQTHTQLMIQSII